MINLWLIIKQNYLQSQVEDYLQMSTNAIILSSVVLFFLGIIFTVMRADPKREKIPPGRLGFPFLGETLSFLAASNSREGVYDFVRVRRLRYGDWFKTRIVGKTHVFAPSVAAAKQVYNNEFGLFKKGYVKSMGDMMGKTSLFVAPKGPHEKIRRILGEPFSLNNVSKFVPKLDKMVTERLQKLEKDGKSFPLIRFTKRLGFDTICDTLMSITDTALLDQIEADCKGVLDAMLTFPVMIPGTKYYRGMKARERLMERFKTIIADRRSGKITSDDFLQSIMERDSYPADDKLEDEEILDNLLTTMLSGQSTTATAMMWCVKYLSDNQHVLHKLREEQLSISRNKQVGTWLTYEDVSKMSYASKVIKETLRMSNVVMWYPRFASDDCTVDGFDIKKGWVVNVDVTHIHYDPAVHNDPLSFDPSRFDEMPKPHTYMPFGSGPRTCLGINMAKVTMSVFLHRLTSGYTWRVDDEDTSLECSGGIAKLRNGCPITLTKQNLG